MNPYESSRATYVELVEGSDYPLVSFALTEDDVAAYLQATEDTSPAYAKFGTVPPLAVAARALAKLAEITISPAGTVHTGEEVSFQKTVSKGESLQLVARVEKRIDRGDVHMLTTEFSVRNSAQEVVLGGRMSAACRATEARWSLRTQTETSQE